MESQKILGGGKDMKREVGTPQRSKEKSATAKDVTANASQDTEGIPEDLDSYFLDA